MSAIYEYNLIKEGDLYNSPVKESTLSRVFLEGPSLLSLYDGEFVARTTITGTAISGSYISVDVQFAESYGVDSARYYFGPSISSSGIVATFGVNTPTDFVIPATVSSGYVNLPIGKDIRYLRLEHSCSPGVVVAPQELHVIGYENSCLSYTGTSAGLGPVGYVSATPLKHTVSSCYVSPIDVRVSVTPQGTNYDKYLMLGTSSSGVFYGIDDHGPSVGLGEELTLVSDSLCYTSGELTKDSSQWEIVQGQTQSSLYSDSGGFHIKVADGSYVSSISRYGANGFWGLISKSSFSLNQSFTTSLQIKLLKMEYSGVSHGSDVVFGVSSGMPSLSRSYNYQWPYNDEFTPARPVRTGVALGWTAEGTWSLSTGSYNLSYLDGDLFQTTITSYSQTIKAWDLASAMSAESFSSALYTDITINKDATSEALFRTFVLSWDHLDRILYSFIDGVYIGKVHLNHPPSSGAHLFFGASGGPASMEVLAKNFIIEKDKVVTDSAILNSGLSVQASRSFDESLFPVSNTVNRVFSYTDSLTGGGFTTTVNDSWVSEESPDSSSYLTYSFNTPQDICRIAIHNVGALSSTLSGTATYGRIPKTYVVFFDTGSGFIDNYALEVSSTLGGVSDFLPYLSANTVASGVQSVRIFFQNFYQLNSTPTYDAAVVDEIEFFVHKYLERPSLTVVSGSLPWDVGMFYNMQPYGVGSSWGISDTSITEVARVNDSSGLRRGHDFCASPEMFYLGSTQPNSVPPVTHQVFLTLPDHEGEAFFGNIDVAWVWYSYPALLWRRFRQVTRVKAIDFVWASGQNTFAPKGFINKFKVQYLIRGGSPDREDDWIDIAPISVGYPGGGDYATYRNWFITHNDGEYYTNVAFAFPGDPGMPSASFELPSDIIGMLDRRWSSGASWVIWPATAGSSRIYLEFDSVVETEAIRLYIADSLDTTRTTSVTTMHLFRVAVFSDTSYGTYVSPVFDLGIENNTERLRFNLKALPSSSGTLYVRSLSAPPEYGLDVEFLNWQPWGVPLNGIAEFDVFLGASPGETASATSDYSAWPSCGVVRGDKVYINQPKANRPSIVYDYAAGLWSTFEAMASQSEEVVADNRITNNAVLLSDDKMYVAVSYGNKRTPKLMRYDFEADEYDIAGWRYVGANRPYSATAAAMVGYGTKILFFCSDGAVYTYNTVNDVWESNAEDAPLHGMPSREGSWAVVVGDTAYLIGGHSGALYTDTIPYIDAYDILNNTWETVAGWVYSSTIGRVQAFYYEDRIYIFGKQDNPNYLIYNVSGGFLEDSHLFRLSVFNAWSRTYTGIYTGCSWLYGGSVYAFSGLYSNLKVGLKCELDRKPWKSGELPSEVDFAWGNFSSWELASVYGETLPQDRYVQFKVSLFASPGEEAASFQAPRVVTSQKIERVGPLMDGNFYTRLGISSDREYVGVYTGWKSSDYYFIGYYSTVFDTYFSRELLPTSASKAVAFGSYVNGDPYRYSYGSPCIISDGSKFKMWMSKYRSYPGLDRNTTSSGVISYACSDDGVEWSSPVDQISYGGSSYDAAACVDPCVIKVSSSDYRMWLSGVDSSGTTRIMYSTSTDGLSWAPTSLVLDVGVSNLAGSPDSAGCYSPAVLLEDSIYHMWYSAEDSSGIFRILECFSVDGVTWSSFAEVFSPRAGSNDGGGCFLPSVLKDIDRYLFWYIGRDSGGVDRVLQTISYDRGETWTSSELFLSSGLAGDDYAAVGRFSAVASTIPDDASGKAYSNISVKVYN